MILQNPHHNSKMALQVILVLSEAAEMQQPFACSTLNICAVLTVLLFSLYDSCISVQVTQASTEAQNAVFTDILPFT